MKRVRFFARAFHVVAFLFLLSAMGASAGEGETGEKQSLGRAGVDMGCSIGRAGEKFGRATGRTFKEFGIGTGHFFKEFGKAQGRFWKTFGLKAAEPFTK